MRLIRPLPTGLSRVLAPIVLLAWVAQISFLLWTAYREARGANLATDLARYGAAAQWRGIYLRGEKIGFSVTQTLPTAEGYDIEEDGRLRMTLLGMTTVTRLRSVARVDRSFQLNSFSFSLDPGTGPVTIDGRLEGSRLHLTFHTAGGVREETRDLPNRPALSLNLVRQLAGSGLAVGTRREFAVLDPATLAMATASLEVLGRDVLFLGGLPVPTYRVRNQFLGLEATMWVTDTGEVVREESPLGMVVVKEDARQATLLLAPGVQRRDLLEIASVVPRSPVRIPDPVFVRRLRLRVEGADAFFATPAASGAGQVRVGADTLEIDRSPSVAMDAPDPNAARYLAAEPLVESDDPSIRAEAQKIVAGVASPAARAERLLRHVHAIIDKRPTVSLPSAVEVLRTRIGDCNEHTALYVALARAAGVPARISVGLVYLLGAFHYHAWAEVYVEAPSGQSRWIPVDPTLNQFPADATHVRLARGGLDQQVAITSMIGRLQVDILDVELVPGTERTLVGRAREDLRAIDIPMPLRSGGSAATCWGQRER